MLGATTSCATNKGQAFGQIIGLTGATDCAECQTQCGNDESCNGWVYDGNAGAGAKCTLFATYFEGDGASNGSCVRGPAPAPAPTPDQPTCGKPDLPYPDNCMAPSPKDAMIIKGTTGNGKTSNTYFSATESPGSGACGGCGAMAAYAESGKPTETKCSTTNKKCGKCAPKGTCRGSTQECSTDADCPQDCMKYCISPGTKGAACAPGTQEQQDRSCDGGQGCVNITGGSFKDMAEALLNLKSTEPSCKDDDKCIGWLATAPAEAMASQYCAAGSNCGLGTDAANDPGPTASAPCGSSFKLTFENGKYANIVVADACPNKSNENWCREKTTSDPNDAGQYNHFDLWVGEPRTTGKQIVDNLGVPTDAKCTNNKCTSDQSQCASDVDCRLGYLNCLGSSNGCPHRVFEARDTPDEVITVLQNYCCGTWSNNKGCPNICGPKFNYLPSP